MFPWSMNLLNTSMSLLAYALISGLYWLYLCKKKILKRMMISLLKNGLITYNIMTILCQKTSMFRLVLEITHMLV